MPTRTLLCCAIACALVASSGCKSAPKPVPTAAEEPLPAQVQPAPLQAEPPPIPAERLETLKSNFARIHFEFDSDVLTKESRDVLQANAQILREHQGVRVTIEGHTDHYGTEEYNVALGERRATTAKRYLVRLGVHEAEIAVVTFGKEKPLVGHGTKNQEAANRRAEFVVTAGSDVADSSVDDGLQFRIRTGQGALPN